jgi:hypothetical protein
MRILERDGIVVDQCRGCGGVFLDHGELERLAAIERWEGDRDDDDDDDDDDRGRRGRRSSGASGWRELAAPAGAVAQPTAFTQPAGMATPVMGPAGVVNGPQGVPGGWVPPAAPPAGWYPPAPAPASAPTAIAPVKKKRSGFLGDLLEGFGD